MTSEESQFEDSSLAVPIQIVETRQVPYQAFFAWHTPCLTHPKAHEFRDICQQYGAVLPSPDSIFSNHQIEEIAE